MVHKARLSLIVVSTTFLVTGCPLGPPTDCIPGGIYLQVAPSLLARVDTVVGNGLCARLLARSMSHIGL